MGFLGPTTVRCPAGRWTTIIATSFAQIPKSWDVHFDGEAYGEFEEKKSSWIFPGAPRRGRLTARMTFDRGYWNTFYSVRVRPDADVVATIE